MRKALLAAALAGAAFFGSVDPQYGDLRFSLHNVTMRHWDFVPAVSFAGKPACAFDETGGSPCNTSTASTYTFTGPSSGTVGNPTSAYTVQGVGQVNPSVTITPADTAGTHGTFNPASVTLSGNASANFTYTPAITGSYTLNVTNSGALTNPSGIAFTSNATSNVTIDSQEVANAGHHSLTSPLTWTFNNVAGNLLIVGVEVTDSKATGSPTIGAVKYNGVALTQITSFSFDTGGNPSTVGLFYLKSPATGSNTISVNATSNGGSYLDILAGAISFDNTTATPVGTPVTATAQSATAAATLGGTTSNDYIVSMVGTGSGVNGATSPNLMSWLLNVSGNTSGDNAALGAFKTNGGSVTPTFSVVTDQWGIIAVEIF